MRLFKTKWFVRYARQERIDDNSLCDAIERAERGLVDADFGRMSQASSRLPAMQLQSPLRQVA